MEEWLLSFLTLTPDGDEWQASHSSHFTLGTFWVGGWLGYRMICGHTGGNLNILSHEESTFNSMYIQSILWTVNINIYFMLTVATFKQSSWWPVTGLLSHRPEVNPEPIHVEFLVEKVTLRQVDLSAAVSSKQYHFTNAPYSFLLLSPSLYR